MIIHFQHEDITFTGGHLVPSCLPYPVLRWELYQQVVCGRSCPLCVKRGSTNDGIVGKGAINYKETNLPSELLRVCPNGYWQCDSPYGEDLGATETY